MLVKDWMSKPAITIDADAVLEDAINLLQSQEISKLPVMQRKQLVGMVTDQDIKAATAFDILSSISPDRPDLRLSTVISDIMTKSSDLQKISFFSTPLPDKAEFLLC